MRLIAFCTRLIFLADIFNFPSLFALIPIIELIEIKRGAAEVNQQKRMTPLLLRKLN